MQIEIRRAQPRDSGRLTEIAHAAKRHWNYPEHWIEAWRAALTVTPDFVERHPVFVATDTEDIFGFIGLMCEGPTCNVEHLWVRPARSRQGIGRRLLEHALALAPALGAGRLVVDSDPHAEDFYVRLGARRIGETDASLDGVKRTLPRLEIDLALERRVVVRDVREADLAAIAPLLGVLGYPTQVEVVQERWMRLASLPSGERVLVAAREGAVLGLATVHFTPVLHRAGDVGRVTSLVVDETCRGQGIGRVLMHAAEEIVRRRGAVRLEITSSEAHASAHGFYRSLGFGDAGVRLAKPLSA